MAVSKRCWVRLPAARSTGKNLRHSLWARCRIRSAAFPVGVVPVVLRQVLFELLADGLALFQVELALLRFRFEVCPARFECAFSCIVEAIKQAPVPGWVIGPSSCQARRSALMCSACTGGSMGLLAKVQPGRKVRGALGPVAKVCQSFSSCSCAASWCSRWCNWPGGTFRQTAQQLAGLGIDAGGIDQMAFFNLLLQICCSSRQLLGQRLIGVVAALVESVEFGVTGLQCRQQGGGWMSSGQAMRRNSLSICARRCRIVCCCCQSCCQLC
jgi:hypothetical protein